jgi:hypothetical protein
MLLAVLISKPRVLIFHTSESHMYDPFKAHLSCTQTSQKLLLCIKCGRFDPCSWTSTRGFCSDPVLFI